jgi:SnoaL-like protein
MAARSSRGATQGDHNMAVRTEIGPAAAADRLAIRELFDAYAHCADRRDAEGQKALFTPDTRFAVYMSGPDTEPTYVLEGREALTPVFADLNQYQATTHFNGQSTIELDGDRATGESYTIAHHLFTADGERKIMIAALRYLDTFVKTNGEWLFAERNLILDWSETRPSTP